MRTIAKYTLKSGYNFQVEYRATTKAQIQDIERNYLGNIPLPRTGTTYEFQEVA